MADVAAKWFASLEQFARSDPSVLGLAVTGSRAVGFEVPTSDYDCALFVTEGSQADVRDHLGTPAEGIDLALFTLRSFAEHARWGSGTAWDRYAWWIADFRVDRTDGDLVALAREKGTVPQDRVEPYVDASLDWYLNQVARSIRCLTRGDTVGGRLEAAESVRPFLQASFAVHDRRLVPYYKFLEWELDERPLPRLQVGSEELVRMVSDLVVVGSLKAQAMVLKVAEQTFPALGHPRRFGEWQTHKWWTLYFDHTLG